MMSVNDALPSNNSGPHASTMTVVQQSSSLKQSTWMTPALRSSLSSSLIDPSNQLTLKPLALSKSASLNQSTLKLSSFSSTSMGSPVVESIVSVDVSTIEANATSRKKRHMSSSPARRVLGDISNHLRAKVVSDNVKSKKAHCDFSSLDEFDFEHPIQVWDGNFAHEPVLYYPPAPCAEELDQIPPLPPLSPDSSLKLPSVDVKTNFETNDTSSSLVVQVRLRSEIHSPHNNDFSTHTFLAHHLFVYFYL